MRMQTERWIWDFVFVLSMILFFTLLWIYFLLTSH